MWFWLGLLCLGLGGLVVLLIAFRVVQVYRDYRRWAPRKWSAEVKQLHAAALRRLQLEREAMRRASVEDEAEDRDCRERAFQALLAGVPVEKLEAYPGIGPGTTARLREVGYRNLAALQNFPSEMPGLGPKRFSDLRQAALDLLGELRSRFEAGGCGEAHELESHLEVLRASRTEHGFRAHARLRAVEAVLQHTRPLLELAHAVTFEAYARPEMNPLRLLPAIAEALPNLELTVQAADDQAARVYAASRSARPTASPAQATQEEASMQTGLAGVQAAPGRAAARVVLSLASPSPAPAAPVDLFREALRTAPALPAVPAAPTVPVTAPPAGISDDLARLRLVVQFALAAARADGRVARREKEVLEKHLRQRCGTDRALLNRAKALVAQYETAPLDVEACFRQIVAVFSVEERQALVKLAGRIAAVTGQPNQREKEFLQRATDRLALAPEPPVTAEPAAAAAEPPAAQPSSPPPEPTPEQQRASLEIDPGAPLSADLVRRQYNLLLERYAPEKFATAGQEFVAMAENRRHAVRAAATALLEQFGEKLEIASPAVAQDLRHNPDLDAALGL